MNRIVAFFTCLLACVSCDLFFSPHNHHDCIVEKVADTEILSNELNVVNIPYHVIATKFEPNYDHQVFRYRAAMDGEVYAYKLVRNISYVTGMTFYEGVVVPYNNSGSSRNIVIETSTSTNYFSGLSVDNPEWSPWEVAAELQQAGLEAGKKNKLEGIEEWKLVINDDTNDYDMELNSSIAATSLKAIFCEKDMIIIKFINKGSEFVSTSVGDDICRAVPLLDQECQNVPAGSVGLTSDGEFIILTKETPSVELTLLGAMPEDDLLRLQNLLPESYGIRSLKLKVIK